MTLTNVKLEHCVHNLLVLYGLTTNLLGYKRLEEEYIVMGMSAFGNPNDDVVNLLKEYYNSFDFYTRRTSIMRKLLIKLFNFRFSVKEEEKIGQHMNFTGTPDMTYDLVKDFFEYKSYFKNFGLRYCKKSIQKFTEIKYMNYGSCKKYGSKLVYSGELHKTLLQIQRYEIYLMMCILQLHRLTAVVHWVVHLSLGVNKRVVHTLSGRLFRIQHKKDINPKEVVDYLMKNKVCGVANGRAEYGQRALGNRSLLGDVRYDIKDTVNKIKQRELFSLLHPQY